MGRKTFRLRQLDRGRTESFFRPFVDREQARYLQEITDAQGGEEPGASTGGHDVAGTGDVVAQGLRRMFSHEDPPGMMYPVHQRPGIRNQQAQVLRCVGVRQFDRLVQAGDEHDPSILFQGRPDDGRPFEFGQLLVNGVLNRQGQCRRGRDQHGGRHRIVFGLRQQVGRDEGRIGRFVGDEQRLGGSRELVYVHDSVDLALGQGHENVTWTHDLVHARDGLGTVGHRGDGLGSTYPIDRVSSGHGGGGQDSGGYRAVSSRRSGDDDLTDAGDTGGDHGHQQR